METYRIARLLPEEARLRAVRATYVTLATGSTRGRMTVKDVCPLGIAFALGYSPDAQEVAEILAMAGGHDYSEALEAANSFIADVDTGLIGPDDVAAALGVSP